MRLEMIGIDYSSAPLELRERFSLTASGGARLAERLRQRCGAAGLVVLSTCNRTELWCSGAAQPLRESYFAELGLSALEYGPYFVCRRDRPAVEYLLELACGMHSQIFGEDQILSQVKEAVRCARERGQTDPVLETLFRTAVTAAKRVKSQVPLQEKDRSVPERALTLVEQAHGSLKGRRCLVIGNGEIGRLLCRLLRERGSEVILTTRSYHHHDTIVPEGCAAVPYEERYAQLAAADFVFSATASPHYTLRREQLLPWAGRLVIVDLAVPRDVEPEIGALPGVTLYNMDELGVGSPRNAAAVAAAKEILQAAADDFYRWEEVRADAWAVCAVGQAVGELTNQKLGCAYQAQEGKATPEQVSRAVEKAVEKLLFTLRDTVPAKDWSRLVDALRHAAAQWE